MNEINWNDWNIEEKDNFEQFYNNWDEYNYIYSFIWCKSNEGFLFWEKLNHKWHNKLKNYYK